MTGRRSARKILVLHAGALGDCVLTLHVVAAMRHAWGSPSVAMVARSSIARWAQRQGLLSEAWSFEQRNLGSLFDSSSALPDSAAGFLRRFDLVVSFLGGPHEKVSERLRLVPGIHVIAVDPKPTDATLRGGLHITKQWVDRIGDAGWPLPIEDPAGAGLSKTEREELKARLVRRLSDRAQSCPATEPRPSARAKGSRLPEPRASAHAGPLRPPEPRASARAARRPSVVSTNTRRHCGHGVVAPQVVALCHPGSGGLDKCCPIEALEELLRSQRSHGLVVGWIVGPDELERLGASFVQRLESIAPVVFEESIEAAADLVCGADVYIGNDAGMTHVAALAGVQTIALFGPTDPRVWRPLGRSCETVSFPTSGRPLDEWIDDLLLRIDLPCESERVETGPPQLTGVSTHGPRQTL